MKTTTVKTLLLVALLLLGATTLALLARADAADVLTAGSFDLSWFTIDGGGASSSAGDYAVSGTIGQPDAVEGLQGGSYQVAGGFWPGAAIGQYDIYLPMIAR